MAVELTKRLFTVADYHLMGQAGLFGEDERVELLAGEVVEMSPISSRHAGTVRRMLHLLARSVDEAQAIISVQNPIRLDDDSEPQPDLALLRPCADFYSDAHPTPADVLLLIEIAETSVRTDRHLKARLYAKAAIPELWVVSLNDKDLTIHRQPTAEGYDSVQTLRAGEPFAPLAFPDVTLTVDEIIP